MKFQAMALLSVLSLTGCGYGSKLDASAACDAWQAKGKQIKIVREYTKDGRFKVQSIDQVSVRKCIDRPNFRLILGEVRRLSFPKKSYGKFEKPEYKTWVAQRFRY